MLHIEPTSQAGKKIFTKLRAEYLKRVRNLASDLNAVDRDYEIDFDQSTIDFLDDVNECSDYYKKAHRALTVLEQAGVI